jgi:hypothetical protein
MALFYEYMHWCAQTSLDIADIVRDRDFSPTMSACGQNGSDNTIPVAYCLPSRLLRRPGTNRRFAEREDITRMGDGGHRIVVREAQE